MSTSYAEIKALHASLPSFKPPLSIAALGPIALVFLVAFFALAFIFTTLPKAKFPGPELGTAFVGSLLAGFGVVALFCTVGVYV